MGGWMGRWMDAWIDGMIQESRGSLCSRNNTQLPPKGEMPPSSRFKKELCIQRGRAHPV